VSRLIHSDQSDDLSVALSRLSSLVSNRDPESLNALTVLANVNSSDGRLARLREARATRDGVKRLLRGLPSGDWRVAGLTTVLELLRARVNELEDP
jgi:hypothetical protein